MNIQDVEALRIRLQQSFDMLIEKIDCIQIGKKRQFPFGWRKAAKGRTVWRIIEEAITQNLEKYHNDFDISAVIPSKSEVYVYDLECVFDQLPPVFINIKSAVVGGRKNKDDISKAERLIDFYQQGKEREIFIATFFIKFNDNMSIHIEKVVLFPIAWIPDVYVNPSNNANLQSSYFKDLDDAIRRTSSEFVQKLCLALDVAKGKKKANINQ